MHAHHQARLRMSSGGGTRTHNLDVNSVALCQLSYPGSHIGLPRKLSAEHLRRNCRHAILDLGVTIRAQKHALLRLAPQPVQRNGYALGVDLVSLLCRLEMMKVKGTHIAPISTDATAPAGLLDEDHLDLPASASDCGRSALLAAVVAPSVEPKLRLAVAHATHRHGRKSGVLGSVCLRRGPPTSAASGLQSVSDQPVSDGRLATSDSLGDLRDRCSFLDQPFELRTCEPSPSRVLASVGCLQSVFLHPVADRRFVQAEPLPYCGQRKSLGQKLLERRAIHAPHCLHRLGHNSSPSPLPAHAAPPGEALSPPYPLSPRARARTPCRTHA
jgi:hypothetical protein